MESHSANRKTRSLLRIFKEHDDNAVIQEQVLVKDCASNKTLTCSDGTVVLGCTQSTDDGNRGDLCTVEVRKQGSWEHMDHYPYTILEILNIKICFTYTSQIVPYPMLLPSTRLGLLLSSTCLSNILLKLESFCEMSVLLYAKFRPLVVK